MISFLAIFQKIAGPMADGGYRVSFDVSENSWKEIAVLPAVVGKELNIIIEVKEDG